jgi:hypothetical protein
MLQKYIIIYVCVWTHVQGETKFMYKISTVWFIGKSKFKILHSICPVSFSFQDTRTYHKLSDDQTMNAL